MNEIERWLVKCEESFRVGFRIAMMFSTLVLLFAAYELFEAGTTSPQDLKRIWIIQIPVACMVVFFAAELAAQVICRFDEWVSAESPWQDIWQWVCRLEAFYLALVVATTTTLSIRSAWFAPLLASTLTYGFVSVFCFVSDGLRENMREDPIQAA